MDDTSDDIIILDRPSTTTITRRFLISQSGLNDEELNTLTKMIVHLKGTVDDYQKTQYNQLCTHIISKDFPVTEKILGALASGKWLLYPRYIHDCYKQNKWLEEQDYELPNYNFAARYHRMGRVNRGCAGLYKNIRLYIKLAQKSYTRAFRRVMAAGEADILLKDIHRANLVITDMQHYEVIAQQLPANSNIVGIDYIKDTLIHRTPLDPLYPLERHFLKRAARYQGTPRKPEAGSSMQGAHARANYVTSVGYTPTKLLHRIKKEPEESTISEETTSHEMRYKTIGMSFKKEEKDRILKIDIEEKSTSSHNKSSDGDLQIIEERLVVRPTKKRNESICEVVDVDDVEITPITTKPQGIKADIDLTGDTSPKEGTLAKIKDIPVIPIILDSPAIVSVSPQREDSITSDISICSKPSEIHVDIPKSIHDSSVKEPHIPDKVYDGSSSTVSARDIPTGPDILPESPGIPSKSLKDSVPPVTPVLFGRVKTRPAALPTSWCSRNKEGISSKPSFMSPTRPTLHTESPGGSSASGVSLGSTPDSSPLHPASTMEVCETSSEQHNWKHIRSEEHRQASGSESASSGSEFTSPKMRLHSTDYVKQRVLSGEGEMEISYNSSPLDVHPIDRITKMDEDVSVTKPLPQKAARKPFLPIDLANCVDPILPQGDNRLPPVVIRKEQINSLVLTFIQKENCVNRTIFSDTTDLCAHNDVEKNLLKSRSPREMSVKETSLYESSMDDTLKVNRRTIKEQEIIVQGIEYLHVALTPEAFPPPRILGHLLRRLVWQETRFPIIHSRALTLVYRVLDFHPPSCSETRSLYLSTLRHAGSTDEQDALNSWTLIKEIINSALDVDDEQDDSSSESSGGDEMIYKSMNSVRLLDFIQTLLQEDLRHWDNKIESMKNLMCVRIFWGERDKSVSDTSQALKVSPQIKKLLSLWIKSSQAPPHIRELIARLVGVVLHLMWLCSGTPLVPVSPLPEPILPLAREIIIRGREVTPSPGVSGGFELLRLIQDLTDPWQRTLVFTILFRSVTQSPNIKFTLADLLDYGKHIGQESEQNLQEKSERSSKRTSKSKKSSGSSDRDKDYLSSHRVNKTNHKKEAALMRACITNKVAEMYKLLAVPGIDINKTGHNGYTALHEAAMRGHNTCVGLLLDYKPKHIEEFLEKDGRCDVMKRDSHNGKTALHDAVASNMVATVKLLLEYGGDRLLKTKTKENENSFDLAETEEMRQVLLSYKGKKGKLDMVKRTAETTKRSGGLQLSQLSHTSLLNTREECQAFLLLLLNTYLNTTGFRFLLFEIKRDIRRSTSLVRKQHKALLMKNGKNEENVRQEKIEECVGSNESSTGHKPAAPCDKKRESIDSNFESKNYENNVKETVFIELGRKNIKDISTGTNLSQPLENDDNLLVPNDKAEYRNMNEIFNYYLKDEDTFKTRKEEFSKGEGDSDFFNLLNFILQ